MTAATIIGHVDSLGYYYCDACKPLDRLDKDLMSSFSYPVPVWSDNHYGETCEMCRGLSVAA